MLNPGQTAFFEIGRSWAAPDGRLMVSTMDSSRFNEKWPVEMETEELWYLTVNISAANATGKEAVFSFQPQGGSLHVEVIKVKRLA
jgi:hypothetical protein